MRAARPLLSSSGSSTHIVSPFREPSLSSKGRSSPQRYFKLQMQQSPARERGFAVSRSGLSYWLLTTCDACWPFATATRQVGSEVAGYGVFWMFFSVPLFGLNCRPEIV